MKNEIEKLHIKQQMLDKQLYHSHIELANIWGSVFEAKAPSRPRPPHSRSF
jgi:hypothetical protein